MALTFTGPIPVPAAQRTPLNVLVTGASRGIGFELVKQYSTAHKGNIVFAGARRPSTSTQLVAFASQHPNVHIVPLDVDNEDNIRASVKHVDSVVDHLDLLINNAGVNGGDDALKTVLETTAAQFNSIINTNVTGVLIVTQTYIPLLQRSTDAKVVQVSSVLGSNVHANALGQVLPAYGVSKAALNYLTTVFRYTVPSVTFLSISPGWCSTDMGNGAGDAPTRVEDSVQAFRHYIGQKTNKNNGEFFDIMSGEIIVY